jgi:hypothetical protein
MGLYHERAVRELTSGTRKTGRTTVTGKEGLRLLPPAACGCLYHQIKAMNIM